MNHVNIKSTPKGFEIPIKVTPKSNKSEVVGWKDGELCIRLSAVPEKGEANQELIRFLSKLLGVAKSHFTLLSGATGRHKRLLIENVSMDKLVVLE